jgi:hypothetical protein
MRPCAAGTKKAAPDRSGLRIVGARGDDFFSLETRNARSDIMSCGRYFVG